MSSKNKQTKNEVYLFGNIGDSMAFHSKGNILYKISEYFISSLERKLGQKM